MSARSLPTAFLGHGSPMLALERDGPYARAVRGFVEALPERPRAIVVVSAHWETPGAAVRVTTTAAPETIHDFGGFPRALFEIRYPAPGAPTVASDALALLALAGIPAEADPARGLDHGAWVPLLHAVPAADIPVVAVSLPGGRTPASLKALGRALAPLRDRGVLLLGSGGVVHNLGRLSWDDDHAVPSTVVPAWAAAFDAWARGRFEARDETALLDWRRAGPQASLAAPTPEHWDPALVVLGASREGDRLVELYEGFRMGSLSLRSFAFAGGAA